MVSNDGSADAPRRLRLDRTSAPVPGLDRRASTGAAGGSVRQRLGRPGSMTMRKPFRLDRTSMTAIERELDVALHRLDTAQGAEGGSHEADEGARHTWRHKLVHFLHCKPVHTLATCLLILDLVIVVISLELQIQASRLEASAYRECLYDMEKRHAVPEYLVHDASCNPNGLPHCDPHHSPSYETAHVLHKAEIGLAIVSCVILTLFLLENVCMLVALRWRYFLHFFFVLDLVVVSVSLGLELWALITSTLDGAELVLGIIIIGRMWRFFRVAHGIYFLEHADEVAHESSPSPKASRPDSEKGMGMVKEMEELDGQDGRASEPLTENAV